MEPLEKKISQLPEQLQKKVCDYVDLLLIQNSTPKQKKKFKLDWAGGLKEFRDKYTGLELQKKALEWRD